MQLQQLMFQEDDKTSKIIDLPQLQLSTEQMIISELHEQLIQIQCSNLKLKDEVHSTQNSLKMVTIEKESLESDIQKLKSSLKLDSNPSYVIKSIQKDPKNLDGTLQKMNEALQYLDKTITRHNYKEELCNFYEDRIGRLTDRYEQLLFHHSTTLSNYHFCKVQLNQVLQTNNTSHTEMLAQQWQQSLNHLKHIDAVNQDLTQENAQMKLRLQESEEQLAKYRKVVLFDQNQYERMFKLRSEMPLTRAEDQVLFFFSQNHEKSEFIRLSKIVDILLKGISELEYELRKNNTDRIKNDYHLIPEQREAELREYLLARQSDFKIAKLENHVQLIQEDMNLLDVLSKPGNQTYLIMEEADDLLSRMHQLLSFEAFDQTIIPTETQETFARQTTQMKPTQSAQNLGTNVTTKKKVQTTNLVQQNNGKKPRIANDYDKKVKPLNTPKLDLIQLESLIRELTVKLSQAKLNLTEEQKLHQRHAHDSISQVTILNESLSYRNKELIEVQNALQKILLSNCEISNHLQFRDFQFQNIQQNSKSQSESIQKIEGLLKVNNFIRKKDMEARSHNDLLTHQLERSSKELLSLSQDNKRLNDQVGYLQRLIEHQREQFRKGGIIKAGNNNNEEGEVPDDDIVKYLVQIDEVNQKNSELEFMLSQALQINIDREKLFRGSEEIIESINSKLETTNALLISNLEVKGQVKMPAFTGPEAVFQRLQSVEKNVIKWKEHVLTQVQEIQKKKEDVEALKPENQTLTSVEHQAKLEKYLNIYSARIQTLSSIIASYQRHFKSLEDQLRDLQNIPSLPQQPSTKQIESQRIESLKRMINLKDILIKHQQNEIEYIKKAIIGDKFNELLVYVTAQEKEALTQMRQFDLQVKVVQDFERQCLLTDEEQYKKGEEQTYLKIVNAKIQQDLINIKEIYKITEKNQEKENNIKIREEKIINSGFRDYFERWLNIVKDLLQSHFDQEKCKSYISALNQEIPILVSIINQASNSQQQPVQLQKGLEKEYIDQKFQEMQQEKEELHNQLKETKERCNFLRAKNQELQEQNLLMKKFMSTKKSMTEAFQDFYQSDLLAENAQLKSKLLSLSPYNEKLALECATLRTQLIDLHEKLLRQDQRILTEQELFQTLEQTLLDTKRKLLEKDVQLVDFIKSKRDQLFKGGTDKALEVLLQTADSLAKEAVQVREINWQMEMNYKQSQRQVEEKSAKIKENKGVLKQYEGIIKDLRVENEKLKVTNKCGLGGLESGVTMDLSEIKGVSKEKLVYELGGRDAAQYALKFVDTQASMREEVNRLIQELQTLKMRNTTLTILAEDRSAKLHKLTDENKSMKKQLREREDQIERLEFQNQRLQDDFLVQQQSLDVYLSMAISFQTGDRSNNNAFNKCIENAQTLAGLLQNAQRQRGFYFQEAIKNKNAKDLLTEQLKCQKHQLRFTQSRSRLQDSLIKYQDIQEQMTNGIIGRYDREIGIVSTFVLQNDSSKTQSTLFSLQDQVEPEKSPKKQQKFSAVDSPPQSQKKQGNIKTIDLNSAKPGIQLQKGRSQLGSIHHFLLCQLQINDQLSLISKLESSLKSLQVSSFLDRISLHYHQDLSFKATQECLHLKQQLFKSDSDSSSLKLQNLSLSRWCLYLHRPQQFTLPDDHDQVSALMSQEIDKLKIENKLIADRNDSLEIKLQHRQKVTTKNQPRDTLTERELQYQVEWNQRLQKELIQKVSQIEALSKVHNGFQMSEKGTGDGEQNQVVIGLRNEYSRLQQACSELHQKLFMAENRNSQKEKKIEMMTDRIRELEKRLLQVDQNNGVNSIVKEKVEEKNYVSEREMQLQAEIEDIWRRYSELNDLKNALYLRNEDLRVEVDSFKTHFSKYEAQEFKKKLAQLGDDTTFQNSLYNELTLMREERDHMSWQISKLLQRVTLIQTRCDTYEQDVIPQMTKELRLCEERERLLIQEVGRAREMQVPVGDSELMLRVSDINRLKRDQVAIRYENSRLHRENQSVMKQVQVLERQNKKMVANEYQLKKRLIEVKNELVRTRVRDDMGEYNTMITGSNSKSPYKMHNNPSQQQIERVQVYVEDLTVMREQMLKVEFRNIELEDSNSRLTRQVDELLIRNKEMDSQLRQMEGDQLDSEDTNEIDGRTTEILDLHRRLIKERWSNHQLQESLKDQEDTIKELKGIQERYMEEVNEHQRMHSEIAILKKTIADYQRHQRLQGADLDDIKDNTLQFYDSQKEKFLTQLSLFLTDLQRKSRLYFQAQTQINVFKDQVFSLSAQVECFDQERIAYRQIIDRIQNDKSHQIEQDFINTSQYEDGMTKLEALIMNQRKKIAHQKGHIDILQNDKQIAEQNLKSVRQIVTKQERQQLATLLEMSKMKDELVKLRNERELHHTRVNMMWDRLEFQQNIYQKVSVDNVTVEQVVKMYKEQIGKAQLMFKNNLITVKKEEGGKLQTEGDRLKMEADIVTMTNRDKITQGHINTLTKELEETKLHIRLADMLRKTIGVSHQERLFLETKLQKKKDKIFKLKTTLATNQIDRERLADRIDFLERQFNLKAGIPNNSSTFVKATGGQEDEDRVRALEADNAQLRQELQSLKFYDSKSSAAGGGATLVSQNSSSTLKSIGGQSRQARAITPVRIRDMPIKQNSLSQRIRQNKQNDTVPGENQDFYYGQDVTIDPMQNLSQEETKLPMIGSKNYVQQLDMRLKNNARNMTPLPLRGASSQYSTLSQPVQIPGTAQSSQTEMGSVTQALKAAGIVNSQIKAIPRITSNLGKSNQISARQPVPMNPNFETVEQQHQHESHSLQNTGNKGDRQYY